MYRKRLFAALCILTLALGSMSGCSSEKNTSVNETDAIQKDSTSTADGSDNLGNFSDLMPEEETQTPEKVPSMDFEVTLVTGETVKLSDYLGKKVLLNFWATWCGPCVSEMPAFQKLHENYGDEVVILAVNCGETAEDVQSFVDKNNYTFPIALDEDLTASSIYPTSSIPLTLIIDEEGYVTYGSYGAADADTMYEHYVNELGLN